MPPELRDAYRFRQGQFLTLREMLDGEDVRRSYSVCVGVPEYERDGELRVAIKRVAGGLFSNWANDRSGPGRGDRRDDARRPVLHRTGRVAGREHYVGFAGGSGITPMLSLIKTTLAVEPRSTFTLVYGNRTLGSIMFLRELEELKNRYMRRLRLYHVLSDEAQEVELLSAACSTTRSAARCSPRSCPPARSTRPSSAARRR